MLLRWTLLISLHCRAREQLRRKGDDCKKSLDKINNSVSGKTYTGCTGCFLPLRLSSKMAYIGGGTAAESQALETALSALSDADFSGLRVCYEVPGRPRGPHVSATELIEAIMKTGQANASRTWSRLKNEGFLNMSGRHVETLRMPGQRGGRLSEVVDVPTALQIIMVLPGKTAARVRVKASVLLTRYLAGDLTLVSQVYGLHELQSYLREHHPEHPLCAFRQSVEAGQTREPSEDRSLPSSAALDSLIEARVQAIVDAAVAGALEMALPRMMAATLEQQAQRHGVLEITRSSHSRAEGQLLSLGTKVGESTLKLVALEGGALHLSVFLDEKGVQPDVVRRLLPTFATEVKRRKLAQHTGEGPLWIAWSQGAWRPLYTEADRPLISEVFEDPLTQQTLEALQASARPARALPPVADGRGRSRAGPYGRLLRGSSGEVTRQALLRPSRRVTGEET